MNLDTAPSPTAPISAFSAREYYDHACVTARTAPTAPARRHARRVARMWWRLLQRHATHRRRAS